MTAWKRAFKVVGGKWAVSKDLVNWIHLDSSDSSRSRGIWFVGTDGRPSRKYYFLFPYHNVCIELGSCTIDWDGREVHHCSYATKEMGGQASMFSLFNASGQGAEQVRLLCCRALCCSVRVHFPVLIHVYSFFPRSQLSRFAESFRTVQTSPCSTWDLACEAARGLCVVYRKDEGADELDGVKAHTFSYWKAKVENTKGDVSEGTWRVQITLNSSTKKRWVESSELRVDAQPTATELKSETVAQQQWREKMSPSSCVSAPAPTPVEGARHGENLKKKRQRAKRKRKKAAAVVEIAAIAFG